MLKGVIDRIVTVAVPARGIAHEGSVADAIEGCPNSERPLGIFWPAQLYPTILIGPSEILVTNSSEYLHIKQKKDA